MPTSRQEFGPFRFEAPSEWSRRALLVFSAPPSESSPSPTTLLMTRDEHDPREELATLAWRRLFERAQQQPNRALAEPHATTIGGQAAFRATLRWQDEIGPLEEMIAWVDAGDGNVLVVTQTSREEGAREPFERLVATLHLAAPTPAAAPSRPSVAPVSSAPPPPPMREAYDSYVNMPMPGVRGLAGAGGRDR